MASGPKNPLFDRISAFPSLHPLPFCVLTSLLSHKRIRYIKYLLLLSFVLIPLQVHFYRIQFLQATKDILLISQRQLFQVNIQVVISLLVDASLSLCIALCALIMNSFSLSLFYKKGKERKRRKKIPILKKFIFLTPLFYELNCNFVYYSIEVRL